MGAREALNKGARKKSRNRRSTRIQKNAWLQDCRLGKLNSPKPHDCKPNEVEELISNFRWNTTLIFKTFSLEEVRKILKIPISLARRPDSYFWSHNSTKQYTVRSTYEAMTGEQKQQERKANNERETSFARDKERA